MVHQRRAMFVDMGPATQEQLAALDRTYARFVRREMKARRLSCYLAETKEGKVVAGGAIWLRETPPRVNFPGGRIPYLMSFYTEPAFRGKGLATRIVKEAMKWGSERGYPWMMLHATAAGRGVYEKLGWEPTSEMRYKITMAGN